MARRSVLRLDSLENRDVPAFLTDAQIVVGADAASPPLVRLIDPTTQAVESQFLAFDPNFFGGVRVAVGDVNGDGHPDLIAAAGPRGGPVVKVYDGKTGAVLTTFFAYPTSFTGGVNVAAADLNGDGRAEIITGAGGGGGPVVHVFDGETGAERAAFFAYDPAVRGGVRVAAGDLDGDGKAEIVVGPGFGGGPDVRAFKLVGPHDARAVGGFFALDPSFTAGLYVASGDLTGDGKDEIVVGAGAGGGPQVGVFSADGTRLSTYFAYSTDFKGGARVGVAELTGDKTGEVLTGPGPSGAAQINVYPGLSTAAATSFFGFPTDQMMGVFVAGSTRKLAIPSTPQQEIDASYAALKTFEQSIQPPAPSEPERGPGGTIVVPVYNYYPWWAFPGYGLGLGYGFGLGFYDAPGLYAPYGIPYAVNMPIAADYYTDPFGYGYSDPVYADPGYYDQGYYDPGYYDPGYYDPTGYSIGDYGYYDYGYSDFGFFGSGFDDF